MGSGSSDRSIANWLDRSLALPIVVCAGIGNLVFGILKPPGKMSLSFTVPPHCPLGYLGKVMNYQGHRCRMLKAVI